MSYVDLFENRHVGTLAGYPLYHLPKGTGPGEPAGHPEFSATPNNLVLGGGSGEHPGLVIHDFDQLVRLYLLHAIELSVHSGRPKTAEIEALEDALVEGLNVRFYKMFEYCGWGIDQWGGLGRAICSPALSTPYDEDTHSSPEHWLAYSLGEFCIMQMPELMSSLMAKTLYEHQEAARDLKSYWIANVNYAD